MDIKELLRVARANTQKGSKDYYKPLPKEQSEMIREYFKSKIDIPLDGDPDMKFYNKSGTLISSGYNRIVVGDYGPFIELNYTQMQLGNIEEKWAGSFRKIVKYVWMQTKDSEKTKIYLQKDTVPYADYRIGCYYIHLAHVVIRDDETRVVNCDEDPYDVYIGRGSGVNGHGKWGNPYSHRGGTKAEIVVETRDEAIDMYKNYLLSTESLLNDLHELKGKSLGCFCKKGQRCHGHIIIEVMKERGII